MENNNELEISLLLNVSEVNTILKALQPLPFGEVAVIVNKIHTQGSPQIAASENKPVLAEVIASESEDTKTG